MVNKTFDDLPFTMVNMMFKGSPKILCSGAPTGREKTVSPPRLGDARRHRRRRTNRPAACPFGRPAAGCDGRPPCPGAHL